MVSAKEFKPIPICKNNYCSTFSHGMIQVSKRWAFKDKCHFISYPTYYCQELIESFDDCEYADNTCPEKEIVYMPCLE